MLKNLRCFFLSLTSAFKMRFFFYLLKYCLFFFVTDFYVENPVFFILFFFSEVVTVPASLWTTIAMRNSRELGKMPPQKKVLSCANRPTLQTSLPFERHVAVAKDQPHIHFDQFGVIQEEAAGTTLFHSW